MKWFRLLRQWYLRKYGRRRTREAALFERACFWICLTMWLVTAYYVYSSASADLWKEFRFLLVVTSAVVGFLRGAYQRRDHNFLTHPRRPLSLRIAARGHRIMALQLSCLGLLVAVGELTDFAGTFFFGGAIVLAVLLAGVWLGSIVLIQRAERH